MRAELAGNIASNTAITILTARNALTPATLVLTHAISCWKYLNKE